MTLERLIKLAHKAGLPIVAHEDWAGGYRLTQCSLYDLQRFYKLAVAEERAARETAQESINDRSER